MNLVSVIIPAYNAEQYLSEAIESILVQTQHNYEIILVDDGSTDSTKIIAASYGQAIRYIYKPNGGIGSALNTGLSQAQGSLFAFLDADDLWLPDKLAIQQAALEQNPEIDLVFGHVQQFISPELDMDAKRRLEHYTGDSEPAYLKTTMLAWRRAFERVGAFSDKYQAGDFLDWYMRAEENELQTLMLPNTVAKRRIHLNNTGARNKDSQQDYARVIRAALLRRRNMKP